MNFSGRGLVAWFALVLVGLMGLGLLSANGCGARAEVAKDKVLAQIDKVLGEDEAPPSGSLGAGLGYTGHDGSARGHGCGQRLAPQRRAQGQRLRQRATLLGLLYGYL